METLKARTRGLGAGSAATVRTEFVPGLGPFLRTLEASLDLAEADCPIPAVLEVDWRSNTIVYDAVDGTSFSERRREGAIDQHSIDLVEKALLAVHRAGYVIGEINASDVLFTAAGPLITNLRHAVPLKGLSRDLSVHMRDADSRRFNRLFGTGLLTAAQLRRLLSPTAAVPKDRVHSHFGEVYAPVILRSDIRWGKIWNTDLGVGRWNFIMKDHLPIPVGGSVLDLGSNNGFNPLQMLRAGAASAIGVEIHEGAIAQARFLKSAFEWLDNRAYDFECIHGSQADLPKFGLPQFDVVTALCSLYYLPDGQIRELVRYIRSLTDVLVLQCNTDRLIDRGGQEETFRKASVEYAVGILEQGGFTSRRIIAPAGYSRPLIIGRA